MCASNESGPAAATLSSGQFVIRWAHATYRVLLLLLLLLLCCCCRCCFY
jgi:hypothetical protein